jgi:hypothetical protein
MTCQTNHDCQVLLERARQIEAILKILRERHASRRRWITALKRVNQQRKVVMSECKSYDPIGRACRLDRRRG